MSQIRVAISIGCLALQPTHSCPQVRSAVLGAADEHRELWKGRAGKGSGPDFLF